MSSVSVRATDQAGHEVERSASYEVGSSLPLTPSTAGGDLHKFWGVCAHPTYDLPKVYGNTNTWTQLVADLGTYVVRGMIAHNLPHVQNTIARARALGFKIHAHVVPEANDLTDATLYARLDYLRANADLVAYLAGVNEPFESERPFTDARARAVVRTQFKIWHYAKGRANGGTAALINPQLAHVKVLSGSMHAVYTTNQMYIDLADIARSELSAMASTAPANAATRQMWLEAGSPTEWWHLFDYAASHYYTGGRSFGYEWDLRMNRIRNNWNAPDILIDETGFTNALNRPSGHNPMSELSVDKLAVRFLLEAADYTWIRGIRWYELCDDPDPQKDDIESNFGMERCPSATDTTTWTHKPVFTTMQNALALLREPDSDFAAYDVPLRVTAPAGVRWRVTTTSDKDPVLWLWRPDTSVWDIATKTDLTVSNVPVDVEWEGGAQTVQVGGRAKSLVLAA